MLSNISKDRIRKKSIELLLQNIIIDSTLLLNNHVPQYCDDRNAFNHCCRSLSDRKDQVYCSALKTYSKECSLVHRQRLPEFNWSTSKDCVLSICSSIVQWPSQHEDQKAILLTGVYWVHNIYFYFHEKVKLFIGGKKKKQQKKNIHKLIQEVHHTASNSFLTVSRVRDFTLIYRISFMHTQLLWHSAARALLLFSHH